MEPVVKAMDTREEKVRGPGTKPRQSPNFRGRQGRRNQTKKEWPARWEEIQKTVATQSQEQREFQEGKKRSAKG